ncbi:DUF3592 domain-containing protein [Luteolibacter sp. LG18]|uniref:DUF3592 domain-containing protein n=1 Tax=Luteolibacter sp. LG18 TaxID=2819286 RepID=UPI002B323A65|nr:hypothetical protein llg_11790 [Luteolibacter sp. LG18]
MSGVINRSGSKSWGAFAFMGLWFLVSSIFVGLGIWHTWTEFSKFSWTKVPCIIERFEIAADPTHTPAFQPDLAFRYRWEGQEKLGTRLWGAADGRDAYESIAEIRETLRLSAGREVIAGTATECRVNPADPDQAILVRTGDGWIGVLMAGMGALFLAIGVCAFRDTFGKWMQLALVSFFGLIGFGVLGAFVVPGIVRSVQARRWVPVPAEVVWSRVGVSHGRGTTYRVDIFYRYTFEGHAYASNRYGASEGGSSGFSAKQQAVDAHPPGSTFTCLVNPSKPWMAVVEPVTGSLGQLVFFALLSLPFAAIGVAGWRDLWKNRGSQARSEVGSVPPATLVLAPPGRMGGAVGLGILAAMCYGPVFLAGWDAWPFLPFGAFLTWHAARWMLTLNGPRFELRMSPAVLAPGGRASLSWRRTTGRGEVRRLTLRLECTEIRGYGKHKRRRLLHLLPLADIPSPGAESIRPIEFAVPSDARPSEAHDETRVEWKLHILTEAPRRPTAKDEHGIEVKAAGS